MKHVFWAVVFCVGLVFSAAFAGDLTRGLKIDGGSNTFSGLHLNRVESGIDQVKLRVGLDDALDLKGYGFVVHFNPENYRFVSGQVAPGHLLDVRDAQQPLFFAVNNQPGQVSVGAVRTDNRSGQGTGSLVDLVFEPIGQMALLDFSISDAVLVDPQDRLDAVNRLEIGALDLKPSAFELVQNVPNPFNPATTIAYTLAEGSLVRLSVYNVLGQEVSTLVNEFKDAGRYTAVWSGVDEQGRQVASGIYFYRLDAGSFHQTRRMLLLK